MPSHKSQHCCDQSVPFEVSELSKLDAASQMHVLVGVTPGATKWALARNFDRQCGIPSVRTRPQAWKPSAVLMDALSVLLWLKYSCPLGGDGSQNRQNLFSPRAPPGGTGSERIRGCDRNSRPSAVLATTYFKCHLSRARLVRDGRERKSRL